MPEKEDIHVFNCIDVEFLTRCHGEIKWIKGALQDAVWVCSKQLGESLVIVLGGAENGSMKRPLSERNRKQWLTALDLSQEARSRAQSNTTQTKCSNEVST
jgi:hypothetical protein